MQKHIIYLLMAVIMVWSCTSQQKKNGKQPERIHLRMNITSKI